MSKLDELIAGIDPKRRSPNKEALWGFIKESLQQVGEINNAYKKYFENPDSAETKSAFEEIEEKIQKIKDSYSDIFLPNQPENLSKVVEIEKKIEEIKQYHATLLEGDESVKSNITNAQEKISEFYEYLFGENEEENGIEPEVRQAIEAILKSKEEITNFETQLNEKTKPLLEEIKSDISLKQGEINALLSSATGSSLAEAYAESKHSYSIPARKPYTDKGWRNIFLFLFNLCRFSGFLLNHALFILPLASVALIFVNEHVANLILTSLTQKGVAPSATDLIYVKTVISAPLVWIAWYGQRNLSQRKRLAEEYNHKLRVVQMYLMFITNENSYKLNDKVELEKTLLSVIARNPSEVYGRDETILDKIADIFHAKKQEVDNVIKNVTNSV